MLYMYMYIHIHIYIYICTNAHTCIHQGYGGDKNDCREEENLFISRMQSSMVGTSTCTSKEVGIDMAKPVPRLKAVASNKLGKSLWSQLGQASL